MTELRNRFEDLDRAAVPAPVESYLDHVAKLHVDSDGFVTEAVAGRIDAGVLDVGCGAGGRLVELATHGHTGRLVGVDKSMRMLRIAHQRAATAARPVALVHADATALPFQDAFDVVHAERVFIHIADVARAVASCVAAARSGGRVVLVEPHGSMFGLSSTHLDLTQRVLSQSHVALRSPWVAMRLPALLSRAGLTGVRLTGRVGVCPSLEQFDAMVQMRNWSRDAVRQQLLNPAEEEAWWADLRAIDARGEFVATWVSYCASGTKP
jgi:SAM-dependent methyltransferase